MKVNLSSAIVIWLWSSRQFILVIGSNTTICMVHIYIGTYVLLFWWYSYYSCFYKVYKKKKKTKKEMREWKSFQLSFNFTPALWINDWRFFSYIFFRNMPTHKIAWFGGIKNLHLPKDWFCFLFPTFRMNSLFVYISIN